METAYFGSSEYSSQILEALCREGVEIPLVITKKPKEKGRGREKRPTPVGKTARKLSLNYMERDNPNRAEVYHGIKESGVDNFLLASYGAILGSKLLSTVKYPLNIHPSLLPRYRGCAPVRRALFEGEEKTGVSIFLMNERLDAGDIVIKEETEILPEETATELKERLSKISVPLAVKILKKIEKEEELKATPQNDDKATYAPRIEKEEMEINWTESAGKVTGKIRGLGLEPGAYSYFRCRRVKILRAVESSGLNDDFSPGETVRCDDELIIKTGKGSVKVLEVKVEGKKKSNARPFINGYHVKKGEIWGK